MLASPGQERRLSETMAKYVSNTLPPPAPARVATEDVLVDPPSMTRGTKRPSIGLTTGTYGAVQDFRNRQLGKAGEQWVFEAERESLEFVAVAAISRTVSCG